MLNKLYEDNALGTIPQDRYEQMSQKYSEEYYTLKAELATLQEQLSAYENAGGRAQKFLKLTERHAAFTKLTPAILNEFISRIEVHERDQKRARYAIQHISIDATIAEYQETLESIKNGTLYSKDNGEGDTYSMIPPTEDVVSEYGVNVTKENGESVHIGNYASNEELDKALNDAVDNGQLTQAEADAANQQ